MQAVLLVGTLGNGLKLYGPYEHICDARASAEYHNASGTVCEALEIHAPELSRGLVSEDLASELHGTTYILTGAPEDGFHVVGPFRESAFVHDYHEDIANLADVWWTLQAAPPADTQTNGGYQ